MFCFDAERREGLQRRPRLFASFRLVSTLEQSSARPSTLAARCHTKILHVYWSDNNNNNNNSSNNNNNNSKQTYYHYYQ